CPNVMPNAACTTGRRGESLTPASTPATLVANQSLDITELYSIALGVNGTGANSTTVLIGGARDNGTEIQQAVTSGGKQVRTDDWMQVEGGDGATVQASITGGIPTYYWSVRSEERRVGKEWRCRWCVW